MSATLSNTQVLIVGGTSGIGLATASAALREGAKPGDLPGVASAELMGQVTRDDDYRRWMDEFL